MYITATKNSILYNLVHSLTTAISNVMSVIKRGGNPEQPPINIDDISSAIKNSDSDTRKVLNRIDTMFPDYAFKDFNRLLRSEAEYTPLASFRTLTEARNANAVGILPKELDCPAELILGPYCSRVSYTVWVLYDENYEATILKPAPTRGKFTCGPDELHYDYMKMKMPKDTTRAIRVVVGTRLHDTHLRGVSIQYYE